MSSEEKSVGSRRVLWPKDLASRWGISIVTLWRWQRSGLAPPPDFEAGRRGWRLETIENFERGVERGGQRLAKQN